MTKDKILVIQPHLQHYREFLFDALIKKNKKTVIAGSIKKKNFVKKKKNYFNLDYISFFNLYYWKGVFAFIIKQKPNIIIMTASIRNLSTWFIVIIFKFTNIKIIGWSKINSDNYNSDYSFFRKIIKKIYYGLFSHLYLYGHKSKKELNYLNVKTKTTIIPNCINENILKKLVVKNAVKKLKKKYKIRGNKKILLYLGKLNKNKRPNDIIKVFKNYDLHKNYRLFIVGNGNLLNSLKKNDFFYKDQIDIIGSTPKYFDYAWLKLAHCLIVTGGTGLAIKQSMFAQTPVIIPDENNVDCEPIINNFTGVVFKKGNIQSLYKKIILFENLSFYKKIKNNAHKHINKFYKSEHMISQFLKGLNNYN